MFFNYKDDFDNFKNSSMIGKFGYGLKILSKGATDLVIGTSVQAAKDILGNPKATSEQREKAQKFVDKFDKY
ncbi:hypothetical protein BKK49_03170 [Rodentibacter rarus]|uniref:Uncharacterized protein n=1 Tax=Rodentibacter rarus TaxID=1908260 RepID=A0A1V3IN82_9PAST|nr:hypothetical protein [Rodentibacter rarus]OOF42229.1 hypothetical protein BKK49_03170 [Rodentibacter rarus]OOF43293.1 hypothetical protein BKK50_05165 [Rodentibacter rarus]